MCKDLTNTSIPVLILIWFVWLLLSVTQVIYILPQIPLQTKSAWYKPSESLTLSTKWRHVSPCDCGLSGCTSALHFSAALHFKSCFTWSSSQSMHSHIIACVFSQAVLLRENPSTHIPNISFKCKNIVFASIVKIITRTKMFQIIHFVRERALKWCLTGFTGR